MDLLSIDQPDDIIASYYEEWKRHRAVIGGARSVRFNSTAFIPRVPGQSVADYTSYITRIPFYPAAARTHEGLKGLIFRKAATVVHPAGLEDVIETITAKGFSIRELARRVASELLITNYCALVTDYPAGGGGMSKAQAVAKGVRPYIALYPAESILGVPETATINNRQRVVRVRLLDDADTIRELRVDDGIYTVTKWRRTGGQWSRHEVITPTRNGEPLDEMPFTLISTNDNLEPGFAPLSAVTELNIDHYLASADYATMRYYSTVRVFIVKGGDPTQDLPVYPGALWKFEKTEVEAEIMGASDNTISELKDAMLDIENKMAAVGSRILENPKAAVESAETIALRRASDNAVVADLTRVLNEGLTDQLKWLGWWMGYEESAFSYEASTDYNVIPITAAERAQIVAEWQTGLYSKDTALDQFIDRDALPDNFDREADAERLAQELTDRPPVDASLLSGNAD